MDQVEHQPLMQSCGKRGRLIVLLLICALALFLAGLFRPFTEVTKLWIFDNKVSVYDGLIVLIKAQEYFLFAILLVFTVIFPFIKILTLLTLWLKGGLSKKRIVQLYGFVSHLGKWSMLDVFVIAILVLLLKSGSVASIKIQDGFVLFFASVMLTQIASVWIGVIAHKNVEES
ncbi:MAG: pqiA [Pedosphaera sp.]|nr:pqiA [Pedosphaera sp.]